MTVHGLSFTPRSDNSLSYSDSYATPTLYSLLYILCSIVYSILGNVLYVFMQIMRGIAWGSPIFQPITAAGGNLLVTLTTNRAVGPVDSRFYLIRGWSPDGAR